MVSRIEGFAHREYDSNNQGLMLDSRLRRLEVEWQLVISSDLTDAANDDDGAAEALAVRIRDIEHAVTQTPARGLMGLAVKIRFLKRALQLGPTGEDELICESALRDLDELMRADA